MADSETFDRIYRDHVWGDGITVPLSGPGSMTANSLPLLWMLTTVTQSRPRFSVADLGCGDLTFMRTVLDSPLGERISYTGIDISDTALRLAQYNRWRLPNAVLFQADITDPRFRVFTDVVVVKDVVFHMENLELRQLLENLRESHYSHLIVTTSPNAPMERVFDSFHYSPVDLESEYFLPYLKNTGDITSRMPRPDGGEYLMIRR